jgi:hypothetical protein
MRKGKDENYDFFNNRNACRLIAKRSTADSGLIPGHFRELYQT